jgi:hypothetical protein
MMVMVRHVFEETGIGLSFLYLVFGVPASLCLTFSGRICFFHPKSVSFSPFSNWCKYIEKLTVENNVSNSFLLSTYKIWKVLVSLAKKNFFFIANFHVLGLFIPKKRV